MQCRGETSRYEKKGIVFRICDGNQAIGAARFSKCNAVRDDLRVIHQNKKDIAFTESRSPRQAHCGREMDMGRYVMLV